MFGKSDLSLFEALMMRSQNQASAVPGYCIDESTLFVSSALPPEKKVVDTGFELVLEVRQGIEMKIEETFSVLFPDGSREEVAYEISLAVLTWTTTAKTEEPEWSHLVSYFKAFMYAVCKPSRRAGLSASYLEPPFERLGLYSRTQTFLFMCVGRILAWPSQESS